MLRRPHSYGSSNGIGQLMRIACMLFVTALLPLSARAEPVLVQNFTHGVCIVPSGGGSMLYGCSDPAATWTVTQWSQPDSDLGKFAAFACISGHVNCQRAWSKPLSATLYSTNGTPHILLAENGATLPCYPGNGSPSGYELDNLAESINSSTYRRHPSAILSRANLGTLASSLTVHATVTPVIGAVNAVNRCKIARGNLLIAVTFNSSTGQTLFDQISIGQVNVSIGSGFFSNSNPFGYREVLTNLGYSAKSISWNSASTLNLNVLSRIKTIISGARNGMDANVAHWSTGGIYVGQFVYGGVSMSSDWSNVSLTGS